MILLKVSFDRTLFEKELKKGLKVLENEEMLQLKQWCLDKFSDMYLSVLHSTFSEGHSFLV